jgi:hypothetical protein
MAGNLEKEFMFFLENREKLAREHQGKFVAIKDQTVIGVYDSDSEAVEETAKKFPLGTFLVQKCDLDESSYRQTFHSRVRFAS